MVANPLVEGVVIDDNTCLLFRVNKRVATIDIVARSFVALSLVASASVRSPGLDPLTRLRANPVSGTPRYQWDIYIPAKAI